MEVHSQVHTPQTVEELFEKLEAIHDDVQNRFHDQWDWMSAAFCVEALKAHFAALGWQRITRDSLPTERDEYSHWGAFDHLSWTEKGFTHFRPIDAPQSAKDEQA